jgi:F-type H+-transporting ATPase subunit b
MLIDWFTVGAQALNFLILVWLMKRFLYKPILNAIDVREKRIAAELADADARKAEAKKERDEFQHKNEEFDQQRAALLAKATDEAKAERQRLLEEAREAADALSTRRQETLRNEAQNLKQAIGRRAQQEVFAIARKALTELATTSLEERVGEVFTRRLRSMDGPAKALLGEALKTASEPGLIRSAFDLSAEQRAAIQNALNETFSAEIRVRFETAPELVGGIELTSNGQKLAWSIADYLAKLEKDVADLLKEQDKPAPKSEVKVEPKPKAESEPKVVPKVEDTKPESMLEDKAVPQSVAEVEPKPAPEAGAKVPPEPAAKAQAVSDPKVSEEPKTPPSPNPDVVTSATPKSEPKANVAVVPEVEPDAKIEAESAAKLKPEAGSKSETKAAPILEEPAAAPAGK